MKSGTYTTLDSIFIIDLTVPSIKLVTSDITKKALSPQNVTLEGHVGTYTTQTATMWFQIYLNYFDP